MTTERTIYNPEPDPWGDANPIIDVSVIDSVNVPDVDSVALTPEVVSIAPFDDTGGVVAQVDTGGVLAKAQSVHWSTIAGIGEMGAGSAFIYSGVKDLQKSGETTEGVWTKRVKGGAKVVAGAGLAADGALRASGRSWVDVVNVVSNGIKHVR